MKHVRLRSTVTVIVVAATAAIARTAEPEPVDVKAEYTKHEYMIPMRDGVRLMTAVYAPKDTSTEYPMLMNRTPYSIRPYGVDNCRRSLGPSLHFARDGYIFVYQDVRGRMGSEGAFVNMRPHVAVKRQRTDIDESTDTYDTIEWLLANVPNHNGKVGQWGIACPGFYTPAGMIDAHPALPTVSPQAPFTEWFISDDSHVQVHVLPQRRP